MSRRLMNRRDVTQQAEAPARHREAPAATRTTALPPYQAPRFPMSEKHQRTLTELTTSNHNYAKYKDHIQASLKSITMANVEVYDRSHSAKMDLRKHVKKRKESQASGRAEAGDGDEETGDVENSEAEVRAERRAEELEQKLKHLSEEAEKSLRQLIDYGDELVQQSQMLTDLKDQVAIDAASAPAPHRRRAARERDPDDSEAEAMGKEDEADDDIPEVPVDVLSPTELFQKARADYVEMYNTQSMRRKYASHNDYVGYVRAIHDAKHQDSDNAPPVPNASTWFPEDRTGNGTSGTPASRKRRDAPDDSDDDEIHIAGEKSSLICPLTRTTFKQPFSNNKCPHTYEKSALIEYFNTNATADMQPSQGRRRQPVQVGPKTLQCAEPGCSVKFELSDFYDDTIMLRKVKRARLEEEREREEGMAEDGLSDIDDVDHESGVEDSEVA